MSLQFDATDADLALFLEEAAEQVGTLSDGLLRMERNAGDAQLLQAVFRAAHTLKGSAATIGHQRMAGLTHAMESVLDDIRKGALAVDTAVIDSLLACVDALNVLNEEVVTRVESEIVVDALVERLQAVAGGRAAAAQVSRAGGARHPGRPARFRARLPRLRARRAANALRTGRSAAGHKGRRAARTGLADTRRPGLSNARD